MNTYHISYFYLATGMEGRADMHPLRVIEAESKEKAAYIYFVMFFESYNNITFNEFKKKHNSEKYWGLCIRSSKWSEDSE